jgi:hypothetical protein
MPDRERKESESPPLIVRRDSAPNELRLDSRWGRRFAANELVVAGVQVERDCRRPGESGHPAVPT